jgi:N-acetyl-anhydromuramyl-L-alanine amidase AmpD
MALLPVRRPYERVKMNVCNQSARSDNPHLIVIHDTESHNRAGAVDLRAIGNWFDNPDAQASAHVCVDAEGISACYVPDARKAWHVAAYNSVSLGIEQIGFATQTFWPDAQLKKVAKYCAYWSKKYGIQLQTRGQVDGIGGVVLAGVVTHAQLGAAGGGHHDPGDAYPLSKMLYHARYYLRNGWAH